MALTVAYRDKMTFDVICRGHQWKIDLPKESGGLDKGPTPPEVFISSLGSCIGVYIVKYCQNIGIDTTNMTIKLDWQDESSGLDNIKVKINIPKAIDLENKKQAIIKVAKQCLIHKTLTSSPSIDIDLQ